MILYKNNSIINKHKFLILFNSIFKDGYFGNYNINNR